jgi:hypothetical protein
MWTSRVRSLARTVVSLPPPLRATQPPYAQLVPAVTGQERESDETHSSSAKAYNSWKFTSAPSLKLNGITFIQNQILKNIYFVLLLHQEL